MENVPQPAKPGKVEKKERKVNWNNRIEIEGKNGVTYMSEFEEVGQNWIPETEGDHVEGYVGHPVTIETDYGAALAVLVGDKRVLISAGLQVLPSMEGKYVRITYTGMQKSKKRKGKEFRAFKVERRVEE